MQSLKVNLIGHLGSFLSLLSVWIHQKVQAEGVLVQIFKYCQPWAGAPLGSLSALQIQDLDSSGRTLKPSLRMKHPRQADSRMRGRSVLRRLNLILSSSS